jgi:carbamoyltransferase
MADPIYVLGAYQGHDGSFAIVGDGKIVHFERERFTRIRHDTLAPMEQVDDACRLIGITREQITYMAGVSGMFGITRNGWDDLMQFDDRSSCVLGGDRRAFGIPHHTAHAAYAYYTSPYDQASILALDGGGDAYKTPEGLKVITCAVGNGNGETFGIRWHPCPGIGGAWNDASHQICGGQFQEGTVMALLGIPAEDFTARTGMDPAVRSRVATLEAQTIDAFHELVPAGRPVVIAGGCALNGIAVHALLRSGHVPAAWVPPACDDGGLSIGAALYVLHRILGEPRRRYSVEQVAFAGWTEPGLEGTPNVDRVVDALLEGQIVALVNGRAESGPRALGHRSLLADPRSLAIKGRLNEMKQRAPWRPVAPVVLRRHARRYFDLIDPGAYEFMTTICQATEEMRRLAPAAVHADGSARVQLVDESSVLGHILAAFGCATGVPMLLNTSFNGHGQAMANTVTDAEGTARQLGVDMLAVGDRMVEG